MTEAIGNRRTLERLPGGGYVYALVDEGVRIEARHVRRERNQVHAELTVYADWYDTYARLGQPISCADLNLSSQERREGRAKYCERRSKTGLFDWVGAIDDAAQAVIKAEAAGTAAIVLDDAPEAGPPNDFSVHGLAIPADSHSQLVTDGGGLKSLLILLVLGEMAKQGIPVVLLDWEWNAARHLARKRRLFGAERLETLFYLRCRNSLSVEHDHVLRFCDEREIQFIGVDSIGGGACDGKLADDDVARAYNRALDDLPPSLAAAHVPKGATDPAADLKAFGSAFFHNYARMTWTVKKQIGASDDVVTVMCVPHKQNDGTRLRPVGLEFTFSPEHIDVRGVDPATVEGLSQTLPIHARLCHLLKTGPRTIADIAQELGEKPDSVSKAVSRSPAFTKLTNTADRVHRIALVERRIA